VIDPNKLPNPYAYISEPLTGRSDIKAIKAFCYRIADVCCSTGIYPYLPFEHTDPVKDADVSPATVFSLDKQLTVGASVAIFYLPGPGQGSFGVGSELVFAATARKPMAILIRTGTTLDKFEQGFLDVEVREGKRGPIIEFSNDDETRALGELAQFLSSSVQAQL